MADNKKTENKIIEAAKQVFIEKGLENAKMSDIAQKAGISRTALNYYYRTKENLFYAIIEQVFDILLPRIENLSVEDGDLVSKVNHIVDIYDELLRNNGSMPRFFFVEVQRNPGMIHDFIAQNAKAQMYLKVLEMMINKEIEAGRIPKIPKSHLISVFFGLVFVPYLLEPLLAMYREAGDESKDEFLEHHKVIVKKMLKAYFE